MSDDRCPKCGASAWKIVELRNPPYHYFNCGSRGDATTFGQSAVCRAVELEQELARRRTNTLLGLRGIEALEDDPDPEFRLALLAGGLKVEVERLRALLHEAWVAADKGEIDGVDLGWMAKCDKLFTSAASEPKEPTP